MNLRSLCCRSTTSAIALIVLSTIPLSCALGPNPNPGERTVDGLMAGGKYGRALEELRGSSEQGYPWAIFRLAVAYEEGLGVEKSSTKAFELYRKIAGVKKDDAWSKGNMLGSPLIGNPGYFNQNLYAFAAQYRLAKFYLRGEGTEQNLVKAYLLVTNLLKESEARGSRDEELRKLLTEIRSKMTQSQLKEAEILFLTWTPQKEFGEQRN